MAATITANIAAAIIMFSSPVGVGGVGISVPLSTKENVFVSRIVYVSASEPPLNIMILYSPFVSAEKLSQMDFVSVIVPSLIHSAGISCVVFV